MPSFDISDPGKERYSPIVNDKDNEGSDELAPVDEKVRPGKKSKNNSTKPVAADEVLSSIGEHNDP